ncbi:MAG: DinB family protein [Gemmatimonadaceae bacterium]
MSSEIREVLSRQYETAWLLADYHLKDLSTEECLWRPAQAGLHVHQGMEGHWVADWPEHERYDLGPPSIGWLTWHLGFWWSMVLDHSFGDGTLSRERVEWPGSAGEVRTLVRRLDLQWRGVLERVTDEELRSTEPTRWPLQGRPFRDIVAWVNIELAKNAAEIGYARFLHATRTV